VRISLFGFLLGATTAGAGMYYYVIDEYRVSNELLTEDIYVRGCSWYAGSGERKLTETGAPSGRAANRVVCPDS
jgi:hypothetical protein